MRSSVVVLAVPPIDGVHVRRRGFRPNWPLVLVGGLCGALLAWAVSAGGLNDPIYRAPVGGSVATTGIGEDHWVRCPNDRTVRVRRGHEDALCRSDKDRPPTQRITIVDRVPAPPPRPMPPMMGGKD